jgi:isopentenyl-diphosphate delta-isomerase
MKSADAVIDRLSCMISELEIAMFLCGCQNVADLKTAPAVIGGRIREILDARGF